MRFSTHYVKLVLDVLFTRFELVIVKGGSRCIWAGNAKGKGGKMTHMDDRLIEIRTMLYGETNQVPLGDDELISVLLTYPACLVAAADGIIDVAERLFLLNVAEELGDGDVDQSPDRRLRSAERYRAFMWLLNEKDKCDALILDSIKEFLKVNEETVAHIKEMVWGMADASDGVSQEEKDEISRIYTALEITETIN